MASSNIVPNNSEFIDFVFGLDDEFYEKIEAIAEVSTPQEINIQMPDTPWYLDPQIFSTLIGLFMGFFISNYSERISWKRRKSEQIREKQLEKVSGFLKIVNNTIERGKKDIETIKGKLQTTNLSKGAASAQVTAIEQLVGNLSTDYSGFQTETKLAIIELNALRLSRKELDEFFICSTNVIALGEYISSLKIERHTTQDEIINHVTEIESLQNNLENSFDAVISNSLSGIGQ